MQTNNETITPSPRITPVLIHVPHSSTYIPSEEWQHFVTPKLAIEIISMTDHYCDDLFSCEHEMLRFPLSRLVCDVERFRDDSEEIMSLKGMGVVYTKCSDGTELKRITQQHRHYLVEKYYDTHHAQFNWAVKQRLEIYGKCVVIDGHSFPAIPLPYEYDQNPMRPDICIGTDEYHTPDWLSAALIDGFRIRGYTVAVNAPFAGTMVPMEYYQKDKNVMSAMIEINRGLYMDEKANRIDRYEVIKRDVGEVVREVFLRFQK